MQCIEKSLTVQEHLFIAQNFYKWTRRKI